MALTETLDLDIRAAQSQLSRLNAQLDDLSKPISVPVEVRDIDDAEFRKIAEALGISEDRARELSGELKESISVSSRLDADLRQVAEAMGLSGREAADFVRQMRRAEEAAEDTATATLRIGTRGVSAFSNLRGSIIGVVGAMGLIAGAGIALRGAFSAIQAASTLEESLSKTNVVFEEFSGQIQDFASNAPRALGLSTAAALESTSTFGNLFVALGLTRDAAAQLSPNIVQLAADLASFNNIAVDEAVEKLRSGLVGEVEPLRALGVNLTAALVEAKALELGLIDASGTVTEAGKVQARYALILEQTSTAQGDYARTADGIANTQRTLTAQFENAKTAVGEALLPAYQALLDIAPAIIEAIEGLAPVVASISQSFADAVPAVSGFADAIQTLVAVGTVIGGLKEASDAVRDFALGIGQLATGGIEQGINQIGEGIDSIQTAADNLNIDIIRNTLVNNLQAGVDPAGALINRLKELAALDLNPQALRDEAQALAAIAGVDFAQAKTAADIIRSQGAAAGLSAPKIQTLTSALLTLAGPTHDVVGRLGEAFLTQEQLADVIFPTAAAVLTEADAIEILGRAADDADVSISALLANQTNLDPALQAAAAGLSTSTLKYLEQVDAINTLASEIGILPGALEAAKQAMKTEEGEIVQDFDTWIANLQATLAAAEAFDFNIALLRALDFGALADALEAGGPELAEVAQQAVEDPVKAGIENARLSGTLKDSGEGFMDDIMAGIEGQPITPGLIDSLIAAGAAAQTPEVADAFRRVAEFLTGQMQGTPVVIPVEADLTAFLASLEGLPGVVDFSVEIPVEAVQEGRRGGRTPSPPSPTRPTDNPFVLNQYFAETPSPTTQTTRAAAEVAAVVTTARGS